MNPKPSGQGRKDANPSFHYCPEGGKGPAAGTAGPNHLGGGAQPCKHQSSAPPCTILERFEQSALELEGLARRLGAKVNSEVGPRMWMFRRLARQLDRYVDSVGREPDMKDAMGMFE